MLKGQLTSFLHAKVTAAVPNDVFMYDDAYVAVFASPVVSDSGTNPAPGDRSA